MRLDQALKKIGIAVIKVDSLDGDITLHLRLDQKDPKVNERWGALTRSFLPLVEEANGWSADISKHLRTSGGQIVFNWRIILSGNVKVAQRILTDEVLSSLRVGVDVMSMELVGQKRYTLDPAKGQTMGAHDPRMANAIVSQGLMGGTPGGGV